MKKKLKSFPKKLPFSNNYPTVVFISLHIGHQRELYKALFVSTPDLMILHEL